MIPDSTNPRVLADNIRALEKKIGSGGGSDLPDIGPSDYGSYLAVDEEGKWGLDRPEGSLPAVDASNVGQILTVDKTGEWTAQVGPKIVFVPSKINAQDELVLDGITYEELQALETAHNGDLLFCVFYPSIHSSERGYYFAKGTYSGSPYWHEPVRFTRVSYGGVEYLDWDIFDGTHIQGLLPKPDNYSTNEINTGLKWTDGKPVYQKTYSGDSLTDLATLETGLETLISSDGYVQDANGDSFRLGTNLSTGQRGFSSVFITSTGNLVITGDNGFRGHPYSVTVRYTKASSSELTKEEPVGEKKTTKKSTKKTTETN